MGFEVVVTYLETHIFTASATFHRTTIHNHDLGIIDSMDVAMGFLDDGAMNKIVGAATINQDDDLSVLDVTDYLEGLGGRETGESIEGDDWFHFGRVGVRVYFRIFW
jgi:hypothetical protein